jgi:hypothetical protein
MPKWALTLYWGRKGPLGHNRKYTDTNTPMQINTHTKKNNKNNNTTTQHNPQQTKTAARQDQTKQAEQSTKRSWSLHACPLDSASEGHSPGTKVFHPDKFLEITDICSHIDSDVRSSFPPWPVQSQSDRPRRPPIQSLRHLRHLRSDWIPLYACYLA